MLINTCPKSLKDTYIQSHHEKWGVFMIQTYIALLQKVLRYSPDYLKRVIFLLKKGKDISREKNIQMILGVGGGSSMDTAKGIAVLATNSGNMIEFLEGKELTDDPLPVVCIPTTSGTGSEVTPYAVFIDPENKRGYSNPKIFSLFSIIDPELTY